MSRRHAVILGTFIAVNVLDAITTHIGLSYGIPEGNPIPALLFTLGGFPAMLAMKSLVCGAVILAALRLPEYPRLWWVFPPVTAILGLIVASNLYLLT